MVAFDVTGAPGGRSPQTPAQWAVRWHGVVFAALLLSSVPVFHVVWHVVLGHDEPPIATRSQTPTPEASWERILGGEWMVETEKHLREDSPVVWWMRGHYNEVLLRRGIVQSTQVHLGRDGWMFHRVTTEPGQLSRFEASAAARRRFFASVRDLVRTAGAELVVVLVPDKVRVYPERAYADGKLPADKEPIYELALQEWRDLGVPVVDLMAPFTAVRAVRPDEVLYHARDTHWRAQGALFAGQATASVIESLAERSGLGPRWATELGARYESRKLGDLVGLIGLPVCEVSTRGGFTRSLPLSLFTVGLLETFDSYGVLMTTSRGDEDPVVDDPSAEVWMLGTSFSEANGAAALALALGRRLRLIVGHGATGLTALHEASAELRPGVPAKVVVWEIIERGLLTADWRHAKL